jgi:hypothetical protein
MTDTIGKLVRVELAFEDREAVRALFFKNAQLQAAVASESYVLLTLVDFSKSLILPTTMG